MPDRRPDTIVPVTVHCPRCDACSVAFVGWMRAAVLAGRETRVCPRCRDAEQADRPGDDA